MTASKDSLFRPFATAAERAFANVRPQPDDDAALIFLDTNVLLAPYRASSEALTAIKKTYAKLRDQKRLVVPAQVAREFAHNRPNLVAQLHKLMRDSRSLSINGRLENVPILVGTPEYVEAQRHLSEMQQALKLCREAIDRLVARIESWRGSDPVLDVYRELFDGAVVKDLALDGAQLEATRKSRYEARIPPGFRDKAKDDGGGGDLIIWFTILEIAAATGRDAILISEDSKDDWFHRSGDQPLFPRYELIEEFAERTSGRAFGIASLSSLLKRHGAADAVVQEVREQERAPVVSGVTGLQEFSRRAQEIVHRALLSTAARYGADVVSNERFPDFVVTVAGTTLGMEVIAIMGHSSLYRRTSERIVRAQQAVKVRGYAELALVFVAYDAVSERALDDWFAEERFLGPGVVAVIARAVDGALRICANQSSQAFTLEAFPRSA